MRHHLAPSTGTAATLSSVAGDVAGIHATDPASVYLGARARIPGLTRAAVAEALYDDRSVLKVLGMRRTMFVVPRDLAAVMDGAVTRRIAADERRNTLRLLRLAPIESDLGKWLADVEAQTIAALEEMGEATAAQLTKRVPGLAVKIPYGEGRQYAGSIGVSTRVLFLLSAENRIIRGRPRGSWLSSLYAWVPMERWLEEPFPRLEVAEAQAELCRRYLRAFGPATQRDLQWWTGWTVATTKNALAAAGAIEVELEDGNGFVVADDLESSGDVEPWVALLPALDTTTMGWFVRGWYLGPHRERLYDTNGNAGPTVWADGHVVGGWAQRGTGEVVFSLLEDVGNEAARKVEAEAACLEDWLADSRIIPRFRTPLEKELVA